MSISAKLPQKLRKAAILISTLDTASADKLLEQMSPEHASRIRLALMELEDINAAEQETVIREFISGGRANHNAFDAGVEMDSSLLEHFTTGTPSEQRRPVSDDRRHRFQFLNEAATDAIGRLLQREHPQVAAVVLAHLPPEKAANILVLFPPDLQTAVLRRVAELDAADPEILHDLEAELQSLLADQLPANRVGATGLSAVHSILSAAGGQDRHGLFENLKQRDAELATRLQRVLPATAASTAAESVFIGAAPPHFAARSAAAHDHPAFSEAFEQNVAAKAQQAHSIDVSFADVTKLSSADLAKLFHRCDPQVTLLALTGAEEHFVEQLLAQLPLRDAKLLRRKMQDLGPILLRDVERAQQRLAEVAARMVSEGAIQIEPRGFAAAA